MLIGYARVSTQDQNLELQREALSKAGCKKVFEDKVSGTRADRPGLAKTLEMLREGDTLVVWSNGLERRRRGPSRREAWPCAGRLPGGILSVPERNNSARTRADRRRSAR